VYDLPITCPKGSEFIPDGARARLNPEQTNIINAAHYLWKSALADNATARDALAKKIPVAPGPELMPKDDPFYGPIEAALSPLDLKAAYVHGVVTTEDVTTKAQQNIPFRLFSFRGVSADTSFFALVGSIGHEFHHAIQGEHDDPLKVGSSFQQTAWREMDAYRQEVTDLERVAVFLRNSPEIPNDLRERHLKSWLTDLAGQVYNASFYNHRFKVQYLASAISTSLGNIDAFLKKQNLSEQGPTIIALQSELAPLLEYKKDLPIDTAKLEETLKRVESFVNSTPALSSKASVEIAKRTEKFLASVTELRQAVPDYLVAQERLQRWGENPAPLP
jgi:hypothetical protein